MAIGALKAQIRAQGCGQRLLDQIDPAGSGLQSDLDHGPLLDAGDPAGNGDDHPGLDEGIFEDLPEELRQHPLRELVVRDNALPQGPHGDHVAGGAAQHIPGRRANLENLAGILIHRHDGGLAQHDAFSLGVDDHVRGSQVDAQVF